MIVRTRRRRLPRRSNIDAVLSDRVPSDKVDAVVMERRLHPTLMVGDGINDAPALAAADVGVALGARGASASSEAADVVIVVDRLDRVSEAVAIARRARRIAIQSIVAGMALSGIAMGFAAFGWLTPVAGALTQEAIDVAVILNALRALAPGWRTRRAALPARWRETLSEEHRVLEQELDKLRSISDALDDASGQQRGRPDSQRARNCRRQRRRARARGRNHRLPASDRSYWPTSTAFRP